MNKQRWWTLLGGAVIASRAAACGGSSGPLFSSSMGTGGSGGSTGSGECATAADCDDGFSCTVDACVAGKCTHTEGPNSGATACPSGEICDLHSGCVPGVVCATTAQCVMQLGSDACKTNIACDGARAICTYATLDKDGDGHPPVVCGGDDCNDDDPAVHPGAPEICDGKDDDCNGAVDDGATCAGTATCQAGACACPPASTCGAECVDKTTDPNHCGSCSNVCPSGATCAAGQCQCTASATLCGGECVDTSSDPKNCSGCGKACPPGFACQGGACACTPKSCASQGKTCGTASDGCGNTLICDDGMKNGGETGVDCGGPCAAKCGVGQGCSSAADCDRGVCDAGQCRLAVSCAELHTQNSGLGDGLYTIDTDKGGAVAPFLVYCDMTIDGGGWTLVGRTLPGGNPNALFGAQGNYCLGNDAGGSFGWTSATGAVTDDSTAYSLDAASKGLTFTQVLLGDYATGKQWGGSAYRYTVGGGYIAAYPNADDLLGSPATVLGTCSNISVAHGGFTSTVGAFHFRDIAGAGWGLYSTGFFTCYNDCGGGNVNGKQGMIFVR